ncbi:transposase, partial [Klebsiella pneumoniae]|nr:transposase [Klebsiella pneumoniae]MED8293350.1 hypothetical protein [Escherichia coli]
KTAYATIKGIEVMRALRKGQASAFYYGDPLGEMRLVRGCKPEPPKFPSTPLTPCHKGI